MTYRCHVSWFIMEKTRFTGEMRFHCEKGGRIP